MATRQTVKRLCQHSGAYGPWFHVSTYEKQSNGSWRLLFTDGQHWNLKTANKMNLVFGRPCKSKNHPATKQQRVAYSAWGSRRVSIPDSYAIMTENDFSHEDAVKRSIERKTGFYFGTWRPDGTALIGGKPSEKHYNGTLCSGNGSVEAEMWISIPVFFDLN